MSTSEDKGKKRAREEPIVRQLKNVCVFGGTRFGIDATLAGEAIELGKELAKRNIDVLYEGGSVGIRGCVASAALIRGRKVGAITLKRVSESRVYGSNIGVELQTPNMHDRMAKMLFYADAFIAIPGGLGTLEDIFNILSWGRLNIHQRPIGLLNSNGFYNGLLSFLDHVVDQGLINQPTRNFLVTASNPAELIDQLQTFKPKPDVWMSQLRWYDVASSSGTAKEGEPDTTLKL